jgi:hypothetical protein
VASVPPGVADVGRLFATARSLTHGVGELVRSGLCQFVALEGKEEQRLVWWQAVLAEQVIGGLGVEQTNASGAGVGTVDETQRFQARSEIGKGERGPGAHFGRGPDAQRRLGHDAQRPFRADKQANEVKASRIFAGITDAGAHDLAGGQHGFKRES